MTRDHERGHDRALPHPQRIGQLARRALGQLARRSTVLPPTWPEEVLFFLTHRCNLRCAMCGQWSEGGYARQRGSELLERELPAESYAKVVREIARFKPRVILCGGEVLLYPQWQEFLDLLSENGLPFTLITNGTHLEAAADRLLASGLDQLVVSIDGPRDLHDQIRGRAGTYDRARAGIQAVLEKRSPGTRPTVSLNTTITKEGWRTLPEVVDAAEDMGVDCVTLLHPNFLDQPLYEAHKRVFENKVGELGSGWDGFVQDFEEFDGAGLAASIEDLRHRHAGATSVAFLPDFSSEEIVAYYRNGLFRTDRFGSGCLGPRNTVNIHPDGEVSPCLGYSVGNIVSESFVDIWRGEKLRSFRRLVEREAMFPACSRCCTYYRY